MKLNSNGGFSATKGHIALTIAYIIFGLNVPIGKAVLDSGEVSPYALSMFRMAGATLLFWTLSLFTKNEKVPVKDILRLAVAGLFGIVLNQQLFVIGLSMTSPIDASIVTTLVPAVTMVIAAIYLKEPITWKKVVGVLIGAAGVLVLILSGGNSAKTDGSIKGNLIILGCVCCYSVYLAVFKPLIMKYRPVTLMKWMFLSSTIITLPLNLSDTMAIDYRALPINVIWGSLYVVVMATFVTYLLVPIGQKNLRPTIVGMYNYIQPIVAYTVAVAIGMDRFGWEKIFAAMLVFAGVYIVNMSRSRAQIDAQIKKP